MLIICSMLHVNLVCDRTAEGDTTELVDRALRSARLCGSDAVSLCVAHCVFI